MKPLLLSLVLLFTLATCVKGQDGNSIVFTKSSQSIALHKGDKVKIQTLDASGATHRYKGKFSEVKNQQLYLKSGKTIPLNQIQRLQIRPEKMVITAITVLLLGALVFFVGLLIGASGLFPPKGQLESPGLKNGPIVMAVGAGIMLILTPIVLSASYKSVNHLQKDWNYEVVQFDKSSPSPLPQP